MGNGSRRARAERWQDRGQSERPSQGTKAEPQVPTWHSPLELTGDWWVDGGPYPEFEPSVRTELARCKNFNFTRLLLRIEKYFQRRVIVHFFPPIMSSDSSPNAAIGIAALTGAAIAGAAVAVLALRFAGAKPSRFSIGDQVKRFEYQKRTNDARALDIGRFYDASKLKGKKVLVTGANRGLGLALTKELVSAGARVVATCRRRGNAFVSPSLAAHRGAVRTRYAVRQKSRPFVVV